MFLKDFIMSVLCEYPLVVTYLLIHVTVALGIVKSQQVKGLTIDKRRRRRW